MNKAKRTGIRFVQYAILIALLISILIPLYLLASNSLKDTKELLGNYFGIPKEFNLANYQTVLHKANYFKYLLNSVLITVFAAVGVYFITPVTSFVIARRMNQYKYFKFLFYFIILGIFVPFQTKMLALVKLLSTLNIMNAFGLIALYIIGSMMIDIFLMVGYIRSIPRDMEEAAIIDGCSRIKSIYLIVYPVITPIISAVLIKDVLWFWNDFLLPLIVVGGKLGSWTLPLFQYNFRSTYAIDYPVAYAAYFMSMIPVLIAYIFFSRGITEGLTEGAVKS